MIRAAGIFLLDKQGQALFLQRAPGGDHVGEWCIPGGKIEEGETALEAACRETKEECGYSCVPKSCREYTRRIKDDVDFTTFCCQIQEPFVVQIGSEVSAFAWASPDNPPRPLHPGCEVVVRRAKMDELDVANAILTGELASPQKYENVWLFDMRITGTGLAYRHKFEEFAWRDSSLYLTPRFLERCNGLPVILEHPKGNTLDTKEYKERNVGSVFKPYIKGDEVWGIVKIFDEPTAQIICEDRLSTSPAVVWRDPKVNVEAELESGEKFFVEGKPSLLDHLAICELGVWDKGKEPSGISTTATGDSAMPDEVRKDEKAAADSAADQEKGMGAIHLLLSNLAADFKGLITRMDSVEAVVKARKDDATIKNRVLGQDDDDDDKGKDSKKAKADGEEEKPRPAPDDDDDDKGRKDKGLLGKGFKKDDDDDARRLSKRKDDDDDDKGKDDDDDKKGKDAVGDPEKLAADKKKRGDDDDDDKGKDKDTRGDSIMIKRSDWDAMQKRVDLVEGKMPKALTDEDFDNFAKIQARYDTVYAYFGKSAPRPINGESAIMYRRRLLTPLKEHDPRWKTADLRVHAVDEVGFTNIESDVLKAATDAARSPVSVPLGQLREHVETRGGHTYTRFYGRPQSWMAGFAPTGRRVKRINQPNKGQGVE